MDLDNPFGGAYFFTGLAYDHTTDKWVALASNTALNTVRLLIYDGLANLQADTPARTTGVISLGATIIHGFSTHAAAYGGYAYITSFGATWIKRVAIGGASAAAMNAEDVPTPGATSTPLTVASAGIGDGPNGVWVQPATANTIREIGGTGGTWEYRRTLYGAVGNDDFAITPEYLWLSSSGTLFLRPVKAATPADGTNVDTIAFAGVVDVTNIDDVLYAINTNGVVIEYDHDVTSAVPAASHRFRPTRLPLGAASRRYGVARSSPSPAWLRMVEVSKQIGLESEEWRLRPGAPVPAQAPGMPQLEFTGGLAADQADGSRKMYGFDRNGIAEFEGAGLDPLAAKVRTFATPSAIEPNCLAVQGDSLWGCRTPGTTIVVSEYRIPASGTALEHDFTADTGITGRAFGLTLRGIGPFIGLILYEAGGTHYVGRLRTNTVIEEATITNVSAVDSSLDRPRSIAFTGLVGEPDIRIYIGERNGRIFAFGPPITGTASLGQRLPQLDATIPIGNAAVAGLTIDSAGIMYALRRQPGDVYSLYLHRADAPPSWGRHGTVRRALASAWGRHRFADSETSSAWGRHRPVLSEQKTASRRWRAAASVLKSAWYRHGPVLSAIDDVAWTRWRPARASKNTGWGRHRFADSETAAAWRRWRPAASAVKAGWLRHAPIRAVLQSAWRRWQPVRASARTAWTRWRGVRGVLGAAWFRRGPSRAPRFSVRQNIAGVRKRYLRL